MKHAFEKAGLKKEDMEFFAHCERYFKSGGEYEQGISLYRQAAEKLGKTASVIVPVQGQIQGAVISHPMPEGHATLAPSYTSAANGLPIPSEGHAGCAPSLSLIADARSLMLSGGHGSGFQSDLGSSAPTEQSHASGEAQPGLPSKSRLELPPARDPNEKFRQALMRDRMQTAAIWLDRNKTSDGRYWSKIHPREFPGMERDAEVIRHIKLLYGEFSSVDLNKELGQILSPDMIKKLASRMERYNALN